VSVRGGLRTVGGSFSKWDQKHIVVHIAVLEQGTARSPCVAEWRWLHLTDADTGMYISAR